MMFIIPPILSGTTYTTLGDVIAPPPRAGSIAARSRPRADAAWSPASLTAGDRRTQRPERSCDLDWTPRTSTRRSARGCRPRALRAREEWPPARDHGHATASGTRAANAGARYGGPPSDRG